MIKVVGWREWASLPELNIPHIKVKIDSGARTSALHAFAIHAFKKKGKLQVRFDLHPLQKNSEVVVSCVADVIDKRVVTDSGGHKEKRYVILTPIEMGGMIWPIEITLTRRDNMTFRMLLGRTAMQHRLKVSPGASFLLGKPLDLPT